MTTHQAELPAQARPARTPPQPAVLAEALGRHVPASRLVLDADVVASLSADDAEWAPVGTAALALRARTEQEVADAVRVCAELGAPVVTRGAGTGLSGGANAVDGCLVLDLSRMNEVLEIDADNLVCVVQPGVVNDDLKAAVRRARALVSARPGQRPVVDDRRQRRDERRWAVLRQVRRHPGLRARAAGGGGRAGRVRQCGALRSSYRQGGCRLRHGRAVRRLRGHVRGRHRGHAAAAAAPRSDRHGPWSAPSTRSSAQVSRSPR